MLWQVLLRHKVLLPQGLSATTCYALGHPLPLGPSGYNQLAANLAGSGLIQGLYTAELADPRTNSADFPGFVDNDSSQWSLRVLKTSTTLH